MPPATPAPTLFSWLGGDAALLRLTQVFYDHVGEDALLAPVFAHMPADHPARVADWLGEVFGGPADYSDSRGGYPQMVRQHLDRHLTEAQRARWAALMLQAADEVDLPRDPEFRSAFVSYIEWGTRLALANSQPAARPPMQMPVPRWDWGTAGPPPTTRDVPQAAGNPADDPAGDPAGDEAGEAAADPAGDAAAGPLPAGDIGFGEHLAPLFRERDRQAMRFAFDLHEYEHVRGHADAILARLAAGTMPCDGAWPAADVELFRRWATGGRLP